jgi:phosphatidylglycerophosphate synthase
MSGDGLREALENGAASGRTVLADGQPAWDTRPDGGNGLVAWARAVCSGQPAPAAGPVAHVLPPQRYVGRATDPDAARRLDAAILGNLGHRQDPNFPRLTGRRISRAISRRLAAAGASPNLVTLGGIACGVLAAVAFAQSSYGWLLAGALLLVFSRLLDDCDGEVARMTVRSTRLGARLDVTGDVVVYTTVFTGLAIGLMRSDPHGGHLWALGLLLFGAGMTTVIVLGAVTGTSLPEHSRLLKFLETGASGDFAYVFLPFALLDAVDIFFWGAAIGAQVYWVLLAVVVLRLRRRLA